MFRSCEAVGWCEARSQKGCGEALQQPAVQAAQRQSFHYDVEES